MLNTYSKVFFKKEFLLSIGFVRSFDGPHSITITKRRIPETSLTALADNGCSLGEVAPHDIEIFIIFWDFQSSVFLVERLRLMSANE
jgi:hypothetical protein